MSTGRDGVTRPLTPDDPILGPARGDADDLTTFVIENRPGPLSRHEADTLDYLNEVYRLAPLVGIDPAIVVAQSALETGNWTSEHWTERRNPAGIGVTDGHDYGHSWANGTDAARAQIVHLWIYTHVETAPDRVAIWPYLDLDPRFMNVVRQGWQGTVRTIRDLTGKWATDPRYAEKIAKRGNELYGWSTEAPSMAKQRVVVVAGHRGIGDAGSAGGQERALTPALAKEYVRALIAAGHDAWYLQAHDDDGLPDDTIGGLDNVGRETVEFCREVNATVMLDVHYEGHGDPNVRGIFAIVPDATGLRTAVPGGAPAEDVLANNPLDFKLASAIAAHVGRTTGLPRRSLPPPGGLGVMNERQTGVGGQGWRLAMFAYTVPVRRTCVRLVIEHGALSSPADQSIIFRDDFTQRCAAGLVAAFAEVYGAAAEPSPPPSPSTPSWYPDGYTVAGLTEQFGRVTRVHPDGHTSEGGFSPGGTVSDAWVWRGKVAGLAMAELPRPVAWYTHHPAGEGPIDVLVFRKGWRFGNLGAGWGWLDQ